MESHHAILSIADSLETSAVPQLYWQSSVDVTHIITDRLRIDDVRDIVRDALQKPITQDKRVFVIVARSLPAESQNALLKIFEEPPVQTQFYIVVPQAGMLIDTLQSRMSVAQATDVPIGEHTLFTTFLKSTYAQRLDMIAIYAKDKDTASQQAIMTGAEAWAVSQCTVHPELLTTVGKLSMMSRQPGSSKKMLLESLALSLLVV